MNKKQILFLVLGFTISIMNLKAFKNLKYFPFHPVILIKKALPEPLPQTLTTRSGMTLNVGQIIKARIDDRDLDQYVEDFVKILELHNENCITVLRLSKNLIDEITHKEIII